MPSIKLQVKQSGGRLLSFLRDNLQDKYTTKQLRWLVEHHRCRLNGYVERFCSKRLEAGDTITLTIDLPPPAQMEKERILFEDDHLLFYNKPAQLTSEELSKLVGSPLVHRLDRDTTGVMLFAKTKEDGKTIEALFKERLIEKTYLALISPIPKGEEGIIDLKLAKKSLREGSSIAVCSEHGKEAITAWKILKRTGNKALVKLWPKTGRMHQLRAHLKAIGSPIVGDVTYGSRELKALRPLLHASEISFTAFGRRYYVNAPIPEDFA